MFRDRLIQFFYGAASALLFMAPPWLFADIGAISPQFAAIPSAGAFLLLLAHSVRAGHIDAALGALLVPVVAWLLLSTKT